MYRSNQPHSKWVKKQEIDKIIPNIKTTKKNGLKFKNHIVT